MALADGFHGQYAKHVLHELDYDPEFEDALMAVILNSNIKQDGIQILDHSQAPREGAVRAADVDHTKLEAVGEEELPLSLRDPRRIYASAIPGVKLTHPRGFLEGGPGLDPDEDTFARSFLSSHPDVTSDDDLARAVKEEICIHKETLQRRMQNRQQAKEQNERIEKDIQQMIDQYTMELKIQKRMLEEAKLKKEARERRRREREAA